ncbi:MAG: helix-turn-helix domain-containing protein [Muribaculaceae bacterium]|nr:helix-turn-helix domain-containing protein [Muribaculaceae bacterium]
MRNPIINLDSIDSYNKLYGMKTMHPLVAVIDLKTATKGVNHICMNYGVYALFLKNGVKCSIKYGRRKYDYQEGTVVSFSPGQMIDVDMEESEVTPDVIGLMFHPDLIYGTPLAEKISEFKFFDYTEMESLHLSEDERAIFLHCLDMIRKELEHPVDPHSAALLSANIQVLLEYMHRFYDRQFITRHKVNSDIVAKFQRDLKMYYKMDTAMHSVPTVSYFAGKASLSPGYFSDLVRKETGLTPKDMITRHIVAHAKQMLVSTDDDVAQIAYALGYEYPAHFTRIFKRVTGQSPTQFRIEISNN